MHRIPALYTCRMSIRAVGRLHVGHYYYPCYYYYYYYYYYYLLFTIIIIIGLCTV